MLSPTHLGHDILNLDVGARNAEEDAPPTPTSAPGTSGAAPGHLGNLRAIGGSRRNVSASGRDVAIDIPGDGVPQTESRRRALMRHIGNFGNAGARNIVSVLIPTAAREAMRRGPFTMLQTAAPTVATGLGATAALTPIALQVVGMARDARNGTQTKSSLASRVALIGLTGGAIVGLAATGGLQAAAPALMAANLIYTPMRDVAQYVLKLGDNNEQLPAEAIASAASSYFLNQVAVGEAMDAAADVLHPALPSLAAHALGRSVVNMTGETVDETTFRGLQAYTTGNNQLEVSLSHRPLAEYSWESAASQLLDTHASRASLFSAAYGAAYAGGARGLSDTAVNVLAAATLGAGYAPFVGVHLKQASAHALPASRESQDPGGELALEQEAVASFGQTLPGQYIDETAHSESAV